MTTDKVIEEDLTMTLKARVGDLNLIFTAMGSY